MRETGICRYFGSEWGRFCDSLDIPHWHIKETNDISYVLTRALEEKGPTLIEVDMLSIGKFAKAFAGPPAKSEPDEE